MFYKEFGGYFYDKYKGNERKKSKGVCSLLVCLQENEGVYKNIFSELRKAGIWVKKVGWRHRWNEPMGGAESSSNKGKI